MTGLCILPFFHDAAEHLHSLQSSAIPLMQAIFAGYERHRYRSEPSICAAQIPTFAPLRMQHWHRSESSICTAQQLTSVPRRDHIVQSIFASIGSWRPLSVKSDRHRCFELSPVSMGHIQMLSALLLNMFGACCEAPPRTVAALAQPGHEYSKVALRVLYRSLHN